MIVRETLAFFARVQGVGAGHVIKMLGKSMKILEVDKRSLMLSSSLIVAVAVNGGRKSNCALKWGLERFSDEGNVMFKLLHVRARITTVPTPMGNYIPISQVRDDVATAYKKEMEWKTSKRLLPHKQLCSEKKVEAEIVQIEADDVPVAISDEVSMSIYFRSRWKSKKGKLHQSKNINTALEGTRVLAKPSLPEAMNKCFLLIASYLVQTKSISLACKWDYKDVEPSQTLVGFGAWGCFAFGEDTKDIITTNLEKLLVSNLVQCRNTSTASEGHMPPSIWKEDATLPGQFAHRLVCDVGADNVESSKGKGPCLGFHCSLSSSSSLSPNLCYLISNPTFLSFAPQRLPSRSSWLRRDWRRFDFRICASSSSATIAKPGVIKITLVPTKPIKGKKTRTSGIHKKVKVFKEENYLANWIKAAALDGQEASVITDYIIKWALERFSDEGKVMFKLLHVRARITTVPTPMGNYIPISQVQDDDRNRIQEGNGMENQERLLPHKQLCSEKKVEAEIVQIEADDVPVAISNEVSRSKKGKLHQSKNIDTALEGLVHGGCFAFGEDTKDIITTNLEKLLVTQVLLTLLFSFSQLGMLSGVLFKLFYGLVES
ncbi:hypothetical protein Sjap_011277 [Stephania japonica]|uniref:Uncharacterized protein n=1 Tax=Stephania japonica TaxID=461633 RepID=A0AAP0JC45_9MAGN